MPIKEVKMGTLVAVAAVIVTLGGAITYSSNAVTYFIPTRAELMAHIRLEEAERAVFKDWLIQVDLILTQSLTTQSRLQELDWEEKIIERRIQYEGCIAAGRTDCALLSPKKAQEGLILQKSRTRGFEIREDCLLKGKAPNICDE